jgi:hypothetical protein
MNIQVRPTVDLHSLTQLVNIWVRPTVHPLSLDTAGNNLCDTHLFIALETATEDLFRFTSL